MKRCMFVDDSTVIRKVAKRILGGPDLHVIEADRFRRHRHVHRATCPTSSSSTARCPT